jgi:hypothetical protein
VLRFWFDGGDHDQHHQRADDTVDHGHRAPHFSTATDHGHRAPDDRASLR